MILQIKLPVISSPFSLLTRQLERAKLAGDSLREHVDRKTSQRIVTFFFTSSDPPKARVVVRLPSRSGRRVRRVVGCLPLSSSRDPGGRRG